MNTPDPTTAAATIGAILLSKKQVENLLSPTTAMLGKQMRNWLKANVLRLERKATKILEDEGTTPRKPSLAEIVPMIQAASKIDDETLSEMFARLLATHLDPVRQGEVHPSFTNIISQLSPMDAKVLWMIDAREAKAALVTPDGHRMLTAEYTEQNICQDAASSISADVQASVYRLSVQNLRHLGLLENFEFTEFGTEHGLQVSTFGGLFLCVCSKERDYWRRNQKWDRARIYAPSLKSKKGDIPH